MDERRNKERKAAQIKCRQVIADLLLHNHSRNDSWSVDSASDWRATHAFLEHQFLPLLCSPSPMNQPSHSSIIATLSSTLGQMMTYSTKDFDSPLEMMVFSHRFSDPTFPPFFKVFRSIDRFLCQSHQLGSTKVATTDFLLCCWLRYLSISDQKRSHIDICPPPASFLTLSRSDFDLSWVSISREGSLQYPFSHQTLLDRLVKSKTALGSTCWCLSTSALLSFLIDLDLLYNLPPLLLLFFQDQLADGHRSLVLYSELIRMSNLPPLPPSSRPSIIALEFSIASILFHLSQIAELPPLTILSFTSDSISLISRATPSILQFVCKICHWIRRVIDSIPNAHLPQSGTTDLLSLADQFVHSLDSGVKRLVCNQFQRLHFFEILRPHYATTVSSKGGVCQSPPLPTQTTQPKDLSLLDCHSTWSRAAILHSIESMIQTKERMPLSKTLTLFLRTTHLPFTFFTPQQRALVQRSITQIDLDFSPLNLPLVVSDLCCALPESFSKSIVLSIVHDSDLKSLHFPIWFSIINHHQKIIVSHPDLFCALIDVVALVSRKTASLTGESTDSEIAQCSALILQLMMRSSIFQLQFVVDHYLALCTFESEWNMDDLSMQQTLISIRDQSMNRLTLCSIDSELQNLLISMFFDRKKTMEALVFDTADKGEHQLPILISMLSKFPRSIFRPTVHSSPSPPFLSILSATCLELIHKMERDQSFDRLSEDSLSLFEALVKNFGTNPQSVQTPSTFLSDFVYFAIHGYVRQVVSQLSFLRTSQGSISFCFLFLHRVIRWIRLSIDIKNAFLFFFSIGLHKWLELIAIVLEDPFSLQSDTFSTVFELLSQIRDIDLSCTTSQHSSDIFASALSTFRKEIHSSSSLTNMFLRSFLKMSCSEEVSERDKTEIACFIVNPMQSTPVLMNGLFLCQQLALSSQPIVNFLVCSFLFPLLYYPLLFLLFTTKKTRDFSGEDSSLVTIQLLLFLHRELQRSFAEWLLSLCIPSISILTILRRAIAFFKNGLFAASFPPSSPLRLQKQLSSLCYFGFRSLETYPEERVMIEQLLGELIDHCNQTKNLYLSELLSPLKSQLNFPFPFDNDDRSIEQVIII